MKAVEAAANAADAEVDRLARLLPNLVLFGVPVMVKSSSFCMSRRPCACDFASG